MTASRSLDYRQRVHLIVAAAEVGPGDVATVSIEHDDGCPMLTGGPCQCVPHVAATINGQRWTCDPDGLVRVERAQ
jgi:hypothetical protein